MIRKVFVVTIVLVAILGGGWFAAMQRFSSWDLRNNLWGPTYLLVHGQSPYCIDALFQGGNAVWFPMAIVFFFPLGWLTQYQATGLWLMSNIVAVIVVVWLSADAERPPLVPFALGLIAFFLFPSTVSHLKLGQFTIVATLAFLLATHFIERSSRLLVVLLLAVSLSKPQLGILILPGLIITYVRIRGAKAAVTLVGLLFLCIALLTVPLFLAYPSWLDDFMIALNRNAAWMQPSLFYVLQAKWRTLGLLMWGLIAVVIFSVNIWLWLALSHREAVFWSLALTPLAAPYVWSWDFVMSIPLLVMSTFRFNSSGARWLLGLGYALCWGLMVQIRLSGDISDHRYWFVPWLLLVSVVGSYVMDKKWAPSLHVFKTFG